MAQNNRNEDIVDSIVNKFENDSVLDSDGDAESYPYPSEYRKTQLDGALAERICRAFGEPVGTPVFITESLHYGGTETTTETDYFHELSCGKSRMDFDEGGYHTNGLNQMLRWLDRESPQQ